MKTKKPARRRADPGERTLDPSGVKHLVIAGWTGRDHAAVEYHIRELEALGVRRPKTAPIFYRVASSLLTTAPAIEVMGEASSGEVEFVLFALDDGLWIGVGSDHTDREAEAIGVTMSKQMCGKPVCARIWRYDDLAPHWDRLMLRSFTRVGKTRKLYQEGSVATMRMPEELIRLFCGRRKLPPGTAMFCGTLPVNGGIAPADAFEMELDDPVLGRTLTHRYRIVPLPNEG
jgi:hypothetical protein